MRQIFSVIIMLGLMVGGAAIADEAVFTKGPLIQDYGPVVTVPGAIPLPEGTRFNIAFDVTERAKEGSVNRRLESAARFLNMHVAAGVKPENIKLAIVIHGKATFDVATDEKHGGQNANAELIRQLIAHGVTFHVCGQSAAHYGVKTEDLLPGVKMELSAMTAHALLQQNGFTLHP